MNWRHTLAKASFGLTARLDFYEEVRDFLKDNIPLHPTIRKLYENASTRAELEYKAKAVILADILRNLEAGRDLSDFLGRWIPQEELQLIAAGERVNDLGLGFEEAANIAQQRAELRSTLQKSLAYPSMLLVALIGFIGYFGLTLIPELAKYLPPERWQGASKTFYEIVNFCVTYAIPLAAALVGAIVAAFLSLPRWTGRMRRYADKVMPWSLYRTYNASTFLVALAAMLRANVPFDAAVRTIGASASPWMAYHLGRVNARMRAGQRPERALDTGLFDDKLAFQIRARGELSTFEIGIENVGRRAIRYAAKRMMAISATVTTVVMIFTATTAFWGYYTGTAVNQQIAQESKRSSPMN